MGRRSAGEVEVDHTLCLLQRGEPLFAPTPTIGGEVTDAGSHGVSCELSVL